MYSVELESGWVKTSSAGRHAMACVTQKHSDRGNIHPMNDVYLCHLYVGMIKWYVYIIYTAAKLKFTCAKISSIGLSFLYNFLGIRTVRSILLTFLDISSHNLHFSLNQEIWIFF